MEIIRRAQTILDGARVCVFSRQNGEGHASVTSAIRGPISWHNSISNNIVKICSGWRMNMEAV